jgi:hypothetical protein
MEEIFLNVNRELKSKIRRFYSILEKYPDCSSNAVEFLNFLRSFLKLRVKDPLPILEIMTIIKAYKPIVFFNLKQMSNQNMLLKILTENSMELKAAKERLNRLTYKYFS